MRGEAEAMSDLDLLNRLAGERDAAREETREATRRAETAEKALSAYKTDGAQAKKARAERDVALKAAREAKKELEIVSKHRKQVADSWAIEATRVRELQDGSVILRARNEELEAEIPALKAGARLLEQVQDAEIRRLRVELRDLKPLQEVIEALSAALRPFVR